MTQDLAFRPAMELAELVRSGAISCVELTRHCIERIERFDEDINAVVVRTFERALEDAAAADAALARGEASGPLHGLPLTIKESYVMQDTPATWGIEAQRDNVADVDGLAVSRFRAAGAHFLGKTNVPVGLADVQSYNPIYGTTNNPWNLERTPGGSSGGSAAALAVGFSALEAGSDIGGSIRTPAHFSARSSPCRRFRTITGRSPNAPRWWMARRGPTSSPTSGRVWSLRPICRAHVCLRGRPAKDSP